jgi:2,3-bisphosphoglycerate-dependent phosphoglycerate mutase
MEQTYGSDTVKKWRKSYDYLPKPIGDNNKNWNGLDDRYSDVSPNLIPQNESLKDTVERVKLYWNAQIQADIEKGKNIIISAHGNSIRALLMYLENINAKDIEEINIPRAIPIIIKFDKNNKILSKTFLR